MNFEDSPSLDAGQRAVVSAAAALAKQNDIATYLVGGPVRDILLGRRVLDLDFAVEGDAHRFAYLLADVLNRRVVENPAFLTYRLEGEDETPIDVVTCRREIYERAGALPTVHRGTLRDDLLRRDFSINALAVDLRDAAVIDVCSGSADLELGVVRVLHPGSFIDDPTRIYRALRLSSRLGFTLAPETDGLLREAVEGDALATVSRQRLWREFSLACEEGATALLTLSRAGTLAPLIGPTKVTDQLENALNSAFEYANVATATRFTTAVAALLSATPEPEEVDLSEAPLRQQKAAQLKRAAGEWPHLVRKLTHTANLRNVATIDRAAAESRAIAAGANARVAEALHLWSRCAEVRVDPEFSRRIAAAAGARTRHYLSLFRFCVAAGGATISDAERFAEAALLRYLQSRRNS